MGEGVRRRPGQAFPGHGQMKPEQLEIERLRREVAKLKAERDILKKAAAYFARDVDMRFAFIAKHRGIWPVAWLCEALDVSRSRLPCLADRPPSEALAGATRSSAPRCGRASLAQRSHLRRPSRLARRAGRRHLCGLHRIERLMRAQALRARPRRRRACPRTTASARVARATCSIAQFDAERPNQQWIADFTYVWTAEGWLYVAAVIDLFSRRVVGWSMSADMTAQLVTDALVMAIWRRGKPDALLHHSDQGSQYTSEQFQRLMADNGVVCSMSRSGNVWDNAAMESFFSSLKTERTARKTTERATRPGPTCSITSSASTIRVRGTRLSAISARWSSKSRRVSLTGVHRTGSRPFAPAPAQAQPKLLTAEFASLH